VVSGRRGGMSEPVGVVGECFGGGCSGKPRGSEVVRGGIASVSSMVRSESCGLGHVEGSALCCLSLDVSSIERVGDRSSSDSSAAEVGDSWCGCGVGAEGSGGAVAAVAERSHNTFFCSSLFANTPCLVR